MKINKNIKRIATFSVVGALGIAAIFAVNNNTLEDSTAITGSWANFVSTSWMNESDARYKNYKETPGTTESSPYLIQTAEEFSGIRAFEGGDALAGKYMLLTADIDLSAHYWDPIELYGYGDRISDLDNEKYDKDLELPNARQVAHFDGNSMKISGMNILNTYDRVVIGDEYYDDYDWQYAGATGLFSYTYKASISNIRLDKPVINLTETSAEPIYENDYGEVRVNDVVGSVVGAAQNSHIDSVHVNDLTLNYTAKFGDVFESSCPEEQGQEVQMVAEGCEAYYMPWQILVGGAVGEAFGETLISETSVKYGTVSVKPDVDETISGDYSDSMSNGIVSVAGLVGSNIHSTVLSTCSSADINFSDDDYNVYERSGAALGVVAEEANTGFPDDRSLDNYAMYFGGLIGFTAFPSGGNGGGSTEAAAARCIYNSCSHSTLNIDAEISNSVQIGGIVGYVWKDKVVNNYYDGNIVTSSDNVVGEIIGSVEWDSVNPANYVRSNFYIDRGNGPVGYDWGEHNYSQSSFAKISTIEKLAADLNTGRAYVIGNLAGETNLTSAQIMLMTTEWSIQDGTFPLACTNERSAGLVFPDNRVDVPNTGAM